MLLFQVGIKETELVDFIDKSEDIFVIYLDAKVY
jgi:hypothetical protein